MRCSPEPMVQNNLGMTCHTLGTRDRRRRSTQTGRRTSRWNGAGRVGAGRLVAERVAARLAAHSATAALAACGRRAVAPRVALVVEMGSCQAMCMQDNPYPSAHRTRRMRGGTLGTCS